VSSSVPCPPEPGAATLPAEPGGGPVWPEDVVRTPGGQPAVVLVRTSRGWTALRPGTRPVEGALAGGGTELPLVEAMALADLIAAEAGATPEPGRQARRAARKGATADDAGASDPRETELADLRRTIGQLEHALAARVSIERAIGVLAERHGSTPHEAFDELRRRARAQGRPAQDLAREVLDGLAGTPAVPDPRTAPEPVPGPTDGPAGVPRPPTARRVTRNRARLPDGPGPGAGARS
jgi:hypothetical protein